MPEVSFGWQPNLGSYGSVHIYPNRYRFIISLDKFEELKDWIKSKEFLTIDINGHYDITSCDLALLLLEVSGEYDLVYWSNPRRK